MAKETGKRSVATSTAIGGGLSAGERNSYTDHYRQTGKCYTNLRLKHSRLEKCPAWVIALIEEEIMKAYTTGVNDVYNRSIYNAAK